MARMPSPIRGTRVLPRMSRLKLQGNAVLKLASGGCGLLRYIQSRGRLHEFISCSAASTTARFGENSQTGSVSAAFPVSNAAWQRQPPKSISLCGQLLHGSGIHSIPRNRLKLSDSCQIQPRSRVRTFSKRKSGIADDAVGQGSTSPIGFTVRYRRPQPLRHGFGRVS